MEKLVVIKREENQYTLHHSKENKTYKFELTFFDIDNEIEIGDKLYFHKELLNPNYEEYSNCYYFGALDQPYGRAINNQEQIDFIELEIKGERIYLKRFFG